jgi:putative intracellular protease/amidase
MIVMPVYQDVDALDVTGPFEMFRWANMPVVLVTETPGPITCNGSVTLVVTTSFNQAPAGEVLWVPGGHPKALNRLMKDETYLGFLRAQAAKPQVKWVCSVCEGALLLAAAGLLDGYEVTTH